MYLQKPVPGIRSHSHIGSKPVMSVSMKASAQSFQFRGSVLNLFERRPALTLERSVGRVAGADTDIWQSGSFGAGIIPDLPVVSSWKELAARVLGRQVAAPQVLQAHQERRVSEDSGRHQQLHVQTLAAQTYTHNQMRQRIVNACNSSSDNQQPADALLLLSGSHPLRQTPLADRWMTSSLQTLKLAHELRLAGDVPAHVGFWAVENPLTNSTDRLRRKIDAGAEVIVTQPPLLWDRFEAWINKVQQQRLLSDTKLIVGCPMISSAANMKFWLYLCQASNLPEATAAMKPFSDAAAKGKQSLAVCCQEYNANLMQQALKFPEVAGFHMMPLTKQARQQTLPLLQSLSL